SAARPATSLAPGVCVELLAAIDRALEMGLVHLGAAGDVHPLRLVVELLLGAALRAARAGAQAAAPSGGHVLPGRAGRLLGLARAGPLLVHGPRRDLLGALGRS